jgi:hypothetical protein
MSYQVIVTQEETGRVWDSIRDTEVAALQQVGLYMACDKDRSVAIMGHKICNGLTDKRTVSIIMLDIFPQSGFEIQSKYHKTNNDVVIEPVTMNNMDICPAHGEVLAEGNICGTCERLGDELIAHIDKRIAVTQGTLYVHVRDSNLSFRVPVYSFNDAKRIYHMALNPLHVDSCKLFYIDEEERAAEYVFQ